MSAQSHVVTATNVVPIQNGAAIDRMGGELLKALVDEVRTAPAQWSKLTETQQAMLIARLRATVFAETEKALFLLAKGQREAARVKIESLTVKDGAKCVLQVGGDSAHDVLDYVGQAAVLVMCNPEQYFTAKVDVAAEKDQADLPLGDAAAPTGDDPIGEVEAEAAAESRLTIDVDEGDDAPEMDDE